MAIPLVEEEILKELVMEAIQYVLDEYQDIILESLSKTLPPRIGINYEIELLPRTRPPTKNVYHMAPSELVEL